VFHLLLQQGFIWRLNLTRPEVIVLKIDVLVVGIAIK